MIMIGIATVLIWRSGPPAPPAPPDFVRPNGSEIRAAVSGRLLPMAQQWNMSFSFGWADGLSNDSTSVVGGPTLGNNCHHKPCPGSLIPSGSTTKAWTAVAIMRAVERGDIALEQPVHTIIEYVIKSQCGFTMLELFGNQSGAASITVEHLLGMTSGIRDNGEDPWWWNWILLHPTKSIGPCELLKEFDTSLICQQPPCKGWYSSINYLL